MIRLSWRSRWWRGTVLCAVLMPPIAMGFVFWRATHAREEAASEIGGRSHFPVRVISLDRGAPSGVESIPASPDFRDIVQYRDTIVVSARAGLYVYDRNGALVHVYRVGLELPSVELGAITAGVGAGSGEPEVFIAT